MGFPHGRWHSQRDWAKSFRNNQYHRKISPFNSVVTCPGQTRKAAFYTSLQTDKCERTIGLCANVYIKINTVIVGCSYDA